MIYQQKANLATKIPTLVIKSTLAIQFKISWHQIFKNQAQDLKMRQACLNTLNKQKSISILRTETQLKVRIVKKYLFFVDSTLLKRLG